jgi:hypothetical protein
MDPSATEELLQLQTLSTQLNKSNSCEDCTDVKMLTDMCKMLTSSEGVSTFEFLRSGMVESLLCYLTKIDMESKCLVSYNN